jgi:hypothetical protein
MMVGTMGNDSSKHPLVQKIAHELLIKIDHSGTGSQARWTWWQQGQEGFGPQSGQVLLNWGAIWIVLQNADRM